MENETIAQKLRRWADEANENTLTRAAKETGIFQPHMDYVKVCEVFLDYIADEIEKEQQAIRNSDCSFRTLAKDIGKPAKDGESAEEWLDRWYLPRPQFEDGEPVQFGDRVVECDHEFSANEIIYILNGDGYCLVEDSGSAFHHPAIRVNRSIKALDANDEPINVGDTVYNEWSSKSFTVERIAVEPEASLFPIVYVKEGGSFRACDLIHREPDSLEKLKADMEKSYDISGVMVLGRYIDRLTAIMERDA